MKINALLLFCSLGIVAIGCGYSRETRVTDLDSGHAPDGLRVQVATPVEILAYYNDSAGKLQSLRTIGTVPSWDEAYDVNFSGGLFTSRTFEVTMHPNGVIKTYQRQNDNQADAALGRLSETVDKVQGTVVEFQKQQAAQEAAEAAAAAPPSPLDQLRASMIQANIEAVQRGEEIPYPQVF